MAAKHLSSPEWAAGRLLADRIIAELRRAAMNTPGIRTVRRRFSKELKGTDRNTVLACAHELIHRAPYGRFVAYELVHFHGATLQSLTEAEVEKLGYGIQSWVDVDTFACYISGPAWHLGRVTDEAIARWTRFGRPLVAACRPGKHRAIEFTGARSARKHHANPCGLPEAGGRPRRFGG